MLGIDLVEVSAKLSQKIMEWTPLYVKITKIIDNHTFETAASVTPVYADDFWCDDQDHKILTAEEKTRLHIQFHRSNGCDVHVLAYVQALKQLCDSGIPLMHEGNPVVDIWVMNANDFDISDIPQTRILKLRDPISGITIPAMSTGENKEMLRAIGAEVCRRFGYLVPEMSPLDDVLRRECSTSVPHWWVAAVVEGQRDGTLERFLVHIDICGAAYDDAGFRQLDGSLVSLQVFTTLEYHFVPGESCLEHSKTNDISHKFIMKSAMPAKSGSSRMRIAALQPFSVRHLRCFHRKDRSGVEITPVTTFIQRNKRRIPGNPEEWSGLIAEMRHDIVLRVPPGAGVVVCNLEKRPELNGRNGHVHESVIDGPPTDRVPVWVEGVVNPLKLKTACLRLTTRKQYSSFKEILSRIEKEDKNSPGGYSAESIHMSKQDKATLKKAMAKDPEMSQALNTLGSGKVTISYYADPKFVRAVRKFLSPPFRAVLPPQEIMQIRDCIEVTDHPKSADAFKILKLIRAGKQKALERNQINLQGDGSVRMEHGSDFSQLMSKIVQRIVSDQELTELFDLMDRKNLFPSPVGAMAHIDPTQ